MTVAPSFSEQSSTASLPAFQCDRFGRATYTLSVKIHILGFDRNPELDKEDGVKVAAPSSQQSASRPGLRSPLQPRVDENTISIGETAVTRKEQLIIGGIPTPATCLWMSWLCAIL